MASSSHPPKQARQRRREKKEASGSSEPTTTPKPAVFRKSARLSKRTSSQDASPSLQLVSGEAHDLPPRPKKSVKSKASFSPTPLPEVMCSVHELAIPAYHNPINFSWSDFFQLELSFRDYPCPHNGNNCVVIEATNGGMTNALSTDHEVVHCSTFSSPGQAHFTCTIIEEVGGLDSGIGLISVVHDTDIEALKVPNSLVSDTEPKSESDSPVNQSLLLKSPL
ncbi:hypothetical protein AMTR_s00117p00138510 [Amborella trichopoda]|uniref:Uncharacterized protein n=1 Tax=Amborella trichopoda TaxID=13333 RepID=W1NP21_AMBTC|nr:hypothetical protein AMTR_s00117p00138510 [Amborella trichopoda]